ncbi:hypothetical protein AHF37_03909 [Paragonimus kellicotti]|nr:hypothetical protein AHF37_03909 [Paragonimus kellicotti]
MAVIPAQKTVLLDTNTAILTMLIIDGGILMFDPTKDVVLSAKYILVINGGQLKLVQDSETIADLIIIIGKMTCIAVSGNAQTVTCQLAGNLPFGDHAVTFSHAIRGKAMVSSTVRVTSVIRLNSVTPATGSFAGGTLVRLSGNGLDANGWGVLIGTAVCQPSRLPSTSNELTCYTPSSPATTSTATVDVTVQVNGVTQSSLPNAFVYDQAVTPQITRINVEAVTWAGDRTHQLTIVGTRLLGDTSGQPQVKVDDQYDCLLNSTSAPTNTQLVCGTNQLVSGIHSVKVMAPVYGYAQTDITFTIDLTLDQVNPNAGHFATQTCVQGDPANQMGAEEYGGHVHIGGPELDSGVVKARLSFVELTYMGQSYRLGRYPVHFHLNGRMQNCGSTTWNNAVFRGLFAWNNDKGSECVNCGGVQFQDMLLVNNDEAGIEGKLLRNGKLYDPLKGPLYKNVHVVGYEESLNTVAQTCHTRAVVLPWSPGLTVSGLIMRNFNGPNCTAIFGTVVTCQCSLLCGGFEYRFNNITWVNTDNRAEFRWHGDYSLRDEDGSLVSGIAGVTPRPGALIVGWANHLPADKCGAAIGNLGTAYSQGDVAGVLCLPEVTALRYTIADIVPKLLSGGKLHVTLLGGGTEDVPYKTRGLTDGAGWMTTLVNNHTYVVNFEGAPPFSNFSYTGHMDNFRDGDYVIIRHEGVPKKPDMVGVIQDVAPVAPFTTPLDPALIIPRDKWLVLDTSINIRLEVFRIAGAFEIISGTQQAPMDYRIAFRQMSIERGRFLAGITPETPLAYANLTLTVCGKNTDPDNLTSIGGTVIGPKAIAVYGQMFLHGLRRLPPWTRLYKTAEAGTKQLRLEEPVGMWQVGDRVVVSTTSKDFRQSEMRTIVSFSDDRYTVELDSNLQYTHVGKSTILEL